MTIINNISDAELLNGFMSNYNDFKDALNKSRTWGANLLTLIDDLQGSPYYSNILSNISTDIDTLKTAATNAITLIDSILIKINS